MTSSFTKYTSKDVSETKSLQSNSSTDWFCSTTAIYKSKYKSINLPTSPILDLVSFIFSFEHNGVSALIDSPSGFSLSYLHLRQMVNSLGYGVLKLGISKGDTVLIILPNTIYFPVIFLGVISIGATVTTMNPLSSPTEIEKRITDCNATLIFTESGNAKKIENLDIRVQVIRVPPVEYFVDREMGTSEFDCFDILVSSHFQATLKPVINQDDTAAILYSSGTTGASKGVILSHGNLIAVVEHFVRFEAQLYNNIYPVLDNVYLAVIPMFHIYGLSLFATGLLALGSIVVVMRTYNAIEMVKSIEIYGVTHLPIVPPILMALTRAKALDKCDLRSLKQVSCGAASTNKKVLQDFLQSFPHVDFIQGYGMTECVGACRGLNTTEHQKHTSVGLLLPNMEAKVMDTDNGSFSPPGNCGELWLRGPSVMKGYLNDEDATKWAIDNDGWLHTGDIVYFDQDGYLYIVDRLKEMIKYKGFQIAPADLENLLVLHPEILDAAVTGYKDDEAGELPMAFVVKKAGSMLSEENVIDSVARQVAPFKKISVGVFLLGPAQWAWRFGLGAGRLNLAATLQPTWSRTPFVAVF